MPRKPSVKVNPFGLDNLFDLALGELDKAITKPNILSYKPYPGQLKFHQCQLTGRYTSGGNRAGKCLLEGTEVQMADGSVKAIEDVLVGEYVLAPDGTATRVSHVWDQGMQDVWEYEVGRYQDRVKVTTTAHHKFWSARESHGVLGPEGKHEIQSLVNTRGRHKIVRSRGTSLGGLREPRAYILGLMLGDGYLSDRGPASLQFTCADPSLAAEFPELEQCNGIQYKFRKDVRRAYFDWFADLGVLGTRSGDKFIPDVVWDWDEQSIGELIAGLAVTDGSWWSSKSAEHHFAFTSKSVRLINDFRRLAGIRLGIWGSNVNVGSKGTKQITYGTREALAKLADLPIFGVKRARSRAMIPLRDSKSSLVGVKKATHVGLRQCYDITVEHETHCFMLANGLFTSNTTSEVIDMIWTATNTHPYRARPERWGNGPLRLRCVVVDVDKGVHGIILPELKRWCSTSMLVNGNFEDSWNNSTLTFTFSNGSTVQFLTHGMDLDKHGGVALHAIYFDEIPPLAVFNENMMRLVDYDGFWVLAATSVEGVGWTYEVLWEPVIEGKIDYIGIFELSQKDNPYLHTEIEGRGKFYVGMDESERKVREEGAFVPRSGRIFPTWNVHDHVLSEHFVPSRDWRWYTSVDFGWNNPTAWLWHAVAPDGRIYTFAEHYRSQMTVQEHAAIVLAKEAFWKQPSQRILRVGDPNNGNAHVVNGISYVSEYANNGVYIGTDITRDVKIGIEKMQQYIRLEKQNGWGKNKPRWMVSPNCVNLIREMKKLRWASYDSAKKAFDTNKQEEVHKKDDHAFDSARYLFALMPELQPSIEEIMEQKAEEGIHLNYQQTIAMLEADDRVAFVDDEKQDQWDVEYLPDWEEV